MLALDIRLKSEFNSVDATGSHQNGKHLLGSSPRSEEEHDKETCNPEEVAMLKDIEADN